jgi:hypothetical protein
VPLDQFKLKHESPNCDAQTLDERGWASFCELPSGHSGLHVNSSGYKWNLKLDQSRWNNRSNIKRETNNSSLEKWF